MNNIIKYWIINYGISLKFIIKFISENNKINECNNDLIKCIIKILLNNTSNVNAV